MYETHYSINTIIGRENAYQINPPVYFIYYNINYTFFFLNVYVYYYNIRVCHIGSVRNVEII